MSSELLRPASKAKRVLAYIIEAALMSVLTIIPVAGPLLAVAYMLGRDGCGNGASPGKMLLGMRVVDLKSGEPADLTASCMRNIPFCIAFFLPFIPIIGHILGVGFATFVWNLEVFVMIFSPMHRRLGDKFAGTCVVEHHIAKRSTAVVDLGEF